MKYLSTLILCLVLLTSNAQNVCIVEYKVFQNASDYIGTLIIPIKTPPFYYEQLLQKTPENNSNRFNEDNPGATAINLAPSSEYKKRYYQVYDKRKNNMLNTLYIGDTAILCKEPIPNIQWKIIGNIKKVGDYNCVNATCAFRGRKYNAWFTTEVPVQVGPWKFNGLPGLIIEIMDESSHFVWSVTKIKFVESAEEFKISNSLPTCSIKEFEIRNFEYYNTYQVEKAKQFLAKFAKRKGLKPDEITFEKFAKKKEDLRLRELMYEWE